jgi:FixJ family two-component response regulator
MSSSDMSVAIVDDDPRILTAIVRLLDSAGVRAATFASPAEFLAGYDANQTGCLVLDLTMPAMSGLDLQRLLFEAGGAPPIIFLTGTGDIPTSVAAMKLGAADFLTKPVEDSVLLDAVQRALNHEQLARRERTKLAELRRRLDSLTPREREVFDQVVKGRLNKQIAADLGTVEKTIKVHRANVMEKLQAESLAELVHVAHRLGVHGAGGERRPYWTKVQ